MTIRAATYALDRPIPYLLQQGGVQTVEFGVRHGTSGALVAVTQAGSTITISRPDGTLFADSQDIVVTDGLGSYEVASTADEDVGPGWEVRLSLVIGGLTYAYRQGAILCEYVPPCPVSVLDIYREYPELGRQVPATQEAAGVGWQPQIDAAYFQLLRELIADARPVHRLREGTDYHERILVDACKRCFQAVPTQPGSAQELDRTDLRYRLDHAKAGTKLGYDGDTDGLKRSASPTVRLAPTGRPQW